MKPIQHVMTGLGAAALSMVMAPAFANTAVEQVGTQSATINGDNNQVIQTINQVNVNHPGLGQGLTNNARRVSTSTSTSATVQDTFQGATINGSGNVVYQESTQINQELRNPQRPAQARPDRGNSDDDRGRGRGNSQNQGGNNQNQGRRNSGSNK
ncbi:hypothetical protein GFS31_01190 [Leptolyngbya sp. BL0902]|uniref:hypothetical protein n=1 Tax=Leptolyngbya sp. BL0902 TaxID=1115757 RepID=UPI0018E8D3AA|nr:hypothetical protein [Leptolyngbya sp. BL0902]QQE63454.1 hypothetical protein GFS31_01190 [Leptolyngbya sp. BL0902]